MDAHTLIDSNFVFGAILIVSCCTIFIFKDLDLDGIFLVSRNFVILLTSRKILDGLLTVEHILILPLVAFSVPKGKFFRLAGDPSTSSD